MPKALVMGYAIPISILQHNKYTIFFEQMQQFPLKQVEQHFKQVLMYAPAMLGNDAVNFFLDSFNKQGWTGSSFQRWPARRSNAKRNNGRAILIQSARLKRSIRVVSVATLTSTVGTDVPYARVHNEGFKGTVNVKAFTRSRYSKEKVGSGKFTKKGKERMKTVQRISGNTTVKAHARKVNIVQRQFMGESPYLEQRLNRRLTAELMKGLRTI